MILKSKFRLDIIPCTVIIVGLMIIVPYPAYIRISSSFDKAYLKEPSIILLLIFIGVIYASILGYFIYEMVRKTLIITINKTEKTILFNYPLKFKKTTYLFDQIIGFRFSSFYTRICDFKTLIVKTLDNNLFVISEYQIANFNKFEAFALDNFDLKKGTDFKSLLAEENIEELEKNQIFNIEQAKSYRTACYFNIGLIITVLVINAYLAIPDRKFGWPIYFFLAAFFIYLIYKIYKANQTIKK